MEAIIPTKIELQNQNAELLRLNYELKDKVQERIIVLIEQSEAFSNCIEQIENNRLSLETELSNAVTTLETHLETVKEREETHISLLDKKTNEIAQVTQNGQDKVNNYISSFDTKAQASVKNLENIYQQHLDDCHGRKDELEKLKISLEEKVQKAKKAIEHSQTQSIEALNGVLESSNEEISKKTEESIEKLNELTDTFKQLAGEAYYNKSSDKIGDEYRKNADRHKGDETKFQYVGGFSIIFAILTLFIWLGLVIKGWAQTDADYHWLPVATITSLFIFLSRWSARIAYRHGLEARRLNQFALDLTAMPAFFAQELLNQGDTEFQTEGKKIVQAKASKMFGNIERFDEQHTHSPMELIWKWVTKRFETAEDKEVISPLNEKEPITQQKNVAKTDKSVPSTETA